MGVVFCDNTALLRQSDTRGRRPARGIPPSLRLVLLQNATKEEILAKISRLAMRIAAKYQIIKNIINKKPLTKVSGFYLLSLKLKNALSSCGGSFGSFRFNISVLRAVLNAVGKVNSYTDSHPY